MQSMKMKSVWQVVVCLHLVFRIGMGFAQVSDHVPSNDRGDEKFRRSSHLDGNNVRVTVHNYGIAGTGGNEVTDWAFEWPKNTRREHIYFIHLWLAAEVTNEDGETISIMEVPSFKQSPEGDSWNFEPVPGFLNPDGDQIARSDDPEAWPRAADGGWLDKREDPVDPGWVGSWNGFFGKNQFNADQEMYYRASDDFYDRFNYFPDETDFSRGGLGLLMDVRAFAWSQILISDAVFFINDIKNDGTKRLSKTSFSFWIADLVGGDAHDDEPFVDILNDIVFITDRDRIGTDIWGNELVGLGAIKILETPGNQVDGIDNDGDAEQHPELLTAIDVDYLEKVPLFTPEDFDPRAIGPGDKIVLIDSLTFQRRIVGYPIEGGTVISMGQTYELPAGGITLEEDTLSNTLDEDLDGLIDERLTLHLERFDDITGTVQAVRYINYLSYEVGDTLKRGFIVPGTTTEQSYQTVAPMIDESRDDGFDNDGDWTAFLDDLGFDGAEQTGDPGEGDGIPTSGAGTDFPGETNIDKTDVSETDLIGITGAIQDPAFNMSVMQDERNWRKFMTPGRFYIPRLTGEYDTYVSSGYFPIEPGERQRMAYCVAMAGDGATKDDDIQSAIQKTEQGQKAYETDYQFAVAPMQVAVTAVPGDGKVTLYWDDVAENSVDQYIKRIDPAVARDFEGYRIYRATDAAFLDPKVITDAKGIPTLRRPIAQFDLKDGIMGYHPVDIFGVLFDMGSDTGLRHSYVDSSLVNGQRYFYAVTAYDYGYEPAGFAPNESIIRVDVDAQGNIITGPNVAVVRPRATVAGYMPAEVTAFTHTNGSSTGQIGFKIVDPRTILDENEYELTFQDTLIEGAVVDIMTTKNVTLRNVTNNSIEIDKMNLLDLPDDFEMPIIDGFQLQFVNEDRVEIDETESRWSSSDIYEYQFSAVSFLTISGEQRPADYEVVMGDVGIATSKDTSLSFFGLPSKDVNFKITNLSDAREVEFGFAELDGNDGRFTINPANANLTDTIMLLEENDEGKLIWTWQLLLNLQPPEGRNPAAGDTLLLYLKKPFLARDVYRFTMRKENASNDLAKGELDDIRVVPNPYVAAEKWEPINPFTSGRGPRELHFINLPQVCTIRIFNVNGILIDTVEHNSTLDNGTAIWDMLSRDNLEISYGIYVYHLEAPGVGQKTGTFAIIK